MSVLFAISGLCLFALMLASFAIARHVRANKAPASRQPDFAQHLFKAAKDQDSRTPHNVAKPDLRDNAATSWNRAPETAQANPRTQFISSKRF